MLGFLKPENSQIGKVATHSTRESECREIALTSLIQEEKKKKKQIDAVFKPENCYNDK